MMKVLSRLLCLVLCLPLLVIGQEKITWNKDGKEMALIPAGSFEMGSIDPEDWILINDIDEIPNLKNIDIGKIKNKLLIFKQQIFYYKFNLLYPSVPWFGSRACRKKNFLSPQWLRDAKHKTYPLWRLDIMFSKKKYNDIFYVDNGGWHFTNIKSAENIEKKLLNYTHHDEFEKSGLGVDDLRKKMKERKAINDNKVEQKE